MQIFECHTQSEASIAKLQCSLQGATIKSSMSVYDTPFWSTQFYDHKARWIHYFNQIRFVADEIRRGGGNINSFSVLEVGPSHGLVNSYLKKFGVYAKTLDIKPEYKPDFLGSVFAMPIPDNTFDMVIACEVLEHYPFAELKKGLAELRRVSKKTVLFSCPDARRILFSVAIKTPFFKEIKFAVRIPTLKTHTAKHQGDHHWEIGKLDYPPSKIRNEIIDAGFLVREELVYPDTPKNHYFLLEKNE